MQKRLALIVCALVVGSLGVATPATAQFPGGNGVIVFYDGGRGLDVVNPNGSGLADFVTFENGYLREPEFSPDGQWVVFAGSKNAKQAEIYKVRSTGTDLTRLTRTAADDGTPSWSPNGKRIIWSAQGKIETMTARGTRARVLLGIGPNFWPRYSPDGDTIVFYRNTGPSHLWLMDADGRHVRKIASTPSSDGCPQYSPDGSHILFASLRSGSRQVWMVNADGSGALQVTHAASGVGGANYSPDGTKIVYTDVATNKVVIANVNGSSPVPIANGQFAVAWQPV